MILFSHVTAVLQKYLNDELEILCLLQFFPDVAQNSREFSMFREIRVFQVFQVNGHPAKVITAHCTLLHTSHDTS